MLRASSRYRSSSTDSNDTLVRAQRLGAEGEACGVERSRGDAERHADAAQQMARIRGRQQVELAEQDQQSGACQRQRGAKATTRRDADSAASSGMTTSQIAAKDSMPPVAHGHDHYETRQRQRGQCVGAFIAAGARQEPGQQDRRNQPGEGRDLECGRRAAHRDIDRERRERRQTAEQPAAR